MICALNQVDIAIASLAFQLGSNLRLIGGLVFVGSLHGYRMLRVRTNGYLCALSGGRANSCAFTVNCPAYGLGVGAFW